MFFFFFFYTEPPTLRLKTDGFLFDLGGTLGPAHTPDPLGPWGDSRELRLYGPTPSPTRDLHDQTQTLFRHCVVRPSSRRGVLTSRLYVSEVPVTGPHPNHLSLRLAGLPRSLSLSRGDS